MSLHSIDNDQNCVRLAANGVGVYQPQPTAPESDEMSNAATLGAEWQTGIDGNVSPGVPPLSESKIHESRLEGNLKGFAKGFSGWSALHYAFLFASGRKGGAFENNPIAKKCGMLFGLAFLPTNQLGLIFGLVGGAAVRVWDAATGKSTAESEPDPIQPPEIYKKKGASNEHSQQQIGQSVPPTYNPKCAKSQASSSPQITERRDIKQNRQSNIGTQNDNHENHGDMAGTQQISQNAHTDVNSYAGGKQRATEPSAPREEPNHAANDGPKDGKVTLAKSNQYRQGGDAACSSIVAIVIRDALKGDAKLHNPAYLGHVVKEGTENFKKLDLPDHLAPFVGHLFEYKAISQLDSDLYEKLEKDETWIKSIQYLPVLELKDTLVRDFERFGNAERVGYIVNGTETWAIVSKGDGTFDLFDSHGKTVENNGNACAFSKRVDGEELAKIICKYNPMLSNPNLHAEMNDLAVQGGLQISWFQTGKSGEDAAWLKNQFGNVPDSFFNAV